MTELPEDSHKVTPARPVSAENTDGRKKWDWETRYGLAKPQIVFEAKLVGAYLAVWTVLALLNFAMVNDIQYPDATSHPTILLRRHDTLVFIVGSVGSTIFAIKWLVHSVANGTWHVDRRLWRIFVPLTGGVYALIVLGLIKAGFMGGARGSGADILTTDLVFAFLAGYFSDGVSGLLTNIANAIFGKVEHK